MNDDRVRKDDRLFSQRHGYTPLPAPMRLEEISDDLRREIWNTTREILMSMTYIHMMTKNDCFGDEGTRLVERVLGRFLKRPEDEIDTEHGEALDNFKSLILTSDFHKVLDLVEIIASEAAPEFRDRVAESFERHAAAYWLDASRSTYQFFPRSNEAQGNATRKAIETIRDGGMDGADAHLRHAAEHLNARRFSDSVRESILAVESVARMVDPKAEKTLGPALTSLERDGLIRHKALKEAFSKLYGYTNDAQGIRHSLLDKDAPDVDLDEAMFMFGACASFAAYLVSKHREAARRRDDGQ